MHIANVLTIVIVTAGVSALPADVPKGDALCGVTPSGNGPDAPLSQPPAATANDCKGRCDEDPTCQAFAFGLPPDAAAPVCKLYGIPPASIPPLPENIVVYAKNCANVPAIAPRDAKEDAKGEKPSGAPPSGKPDGPKPTGLPPSGKPHGPKPSGTPRSGKPHGPKPTGPKPTGLKPTGPPPSGTPPGPKPTGPPPSGKPSGPKPTGPASAGETASAPKELSQRNLCGGQPSGPSSSAPAPLLNPTPLNVANDCLQLGKQTPGCQSVEFGIFALHGEKLCKLFNVPAAKLPPPSADQSLVVFDVGC